MIDGRGLRYADYGDGPALLLIHGLGGSWQSWLEVLPALSRRHRVIAVDLPGFGRSEELPPPAAMDTHAEAFASLLAGLGIERAVVAGHSMGGLVALSLAQARPEVVASLVLVNAGGISLGRLRLAAIVRVFTIANALLGRPSVMKALARRPRLRRLMLRGFVTDPRCMSPELAEETIPLMAAPGFVGAVAAASRVARALDSAQIGCPVLLVWGRDDRILPLAGAESLLDRLSDGRLVVIDRAGHCPMFERPEELVRAVLDFGECAKF